MPAPTGRGRGFKGGRRVVRPGSTVHGQIKIQNLDTDREAAEVFVDLVPLLLAKKSFNTFHGLVARHTTDYYEAHTFLGLPVGTAYAVYRDADAVAWWSAHTGWSISGIDAGGTDWRDTLLHRALIVVAQTGSISNVTPVQPDRVLNGVLKED